MVVGGIVSGNSEVSGMVNGDGEGWDGKWKW